MLTIILSYFQSQVRHVGSTGRNGVSGIILILPALTKGLYALVLSIGDFLCLVRKLAQLGSLHHKGEHVAGPAGTGCVSVRL